MTIKKLFNTCIRASVIAVAILFFMSSIVASARLADVVTNLPNPIPADRTTVFTLYLPYGNPTGDLDVRNAVASLNLTGSGFEIVTSGISDLYYGSPTRPDSANPPDVPVCNSSYTGPAYPISSTLATSTTLTYGLQSARDQNSPSGSATEMLRFKSTGCIKVDIKVASGATQGQTTQLTFDEDSAGSPDYQDSRRPGRQVINMSVGAPTNVVTCNNTQDSVNGQCVPKCGSNQTRNSAGICVDNTPNCNNTQDLVNNQCVPKCSSNQTRNSAGTCVDNTPTCNNTQDLVNNQCVPKCGSNQTRDSSGSCACSSGFETVNANCVPVCTNSQVRDSSGTCVSTTVTCNNTQDLVNGQCVPKCDTNQTRNTAGQCVATTLTCETNTQDLVNGACVAKCSANQIRDTTGACVPVQTNPVCSTTQDLINGVCVSKCASNQTRNSTGVCITNNPVNNATTPTTPTTPATPTSNLPRTGGVELISAIAIVAATVGGWLYWRSRKHNLTKKVSLTNSQNKD